MYKITAYRSVPMTPDNSDILYITSVAFLSFLDRYAAGTAKTMGNEFNPAQGIIYTGLLVDSIVPSETIENRAKKMQAVNYIKIDMYDKQGTNILKSYFYFVTDVEMMYIKNESAVSQTEIDGYFFALSIMRDVWATDFVSNEVVDEFQDPFPTISGGRMIAGHREASLFSDVSKLPAVEIIQPEITRTTPDRFYPLSDDTTHMSQYAIVISVVISDIEAEIVTSAEMKTFLSYTPFTWLKTGDNLYKTIMEQLPQVRFIQKGSAGKKMAVDIVRIMLVHKKFFNGYYPNTSPTPPPFWTFYFSDKDEAEAVGGNFYEEEGGEYRLQFSLDNAVTFDSEHLYTFGTRAQRIALINEKDRAHEVRITTAFAGTDVQIIMDIDDNNIDITDDFICPLTTNETAAQMNERLIARKIGMINSISTIAGGAASIAGGVASKSPTGILAGIGTVAGGVTDIIQQRISPKNSGVAMKTEASGLICVLPAFDGLYIERWEAENIDDIQNTENLYGYSFEGVDYMGSITPFTEQTGINYNYLQIENISFSPPYIQYSALEWLKQRFADGVRIWYDATKYASTVRGTVPHKTE